MKELFKNRFFALTAGVLLLIGCLFIHQDDHAQAKQSAASLNADALASAGRRDLILGFNVGFLQNIDGIAVALPQIRKDGFTHIRVYYPWSKKLDSNKKIVTHMEKLVNNGLVPLLGVAGHPLGLKTDERKKSAWKADLSDRQRSVISGREDLLNLYPPSDLKQYSQQLGSMITEMEKSFGKDRIRNWTFEIGNEPNAQVFFWGNVDDFGNVFKTTGDTLKQLDTANRVGCCGFAARILTDPGKHKKYLEFLEGIKDNSKVDFISFHIYENVFSGNDELRQKVKDFVNRYGSRHNMYVTEWNVDVDTRAASAIIDSPAFMKHLINIVKTCYDNRIDRLYIHKLMDNPAQDEEQLGLFSSDGKAKQGYRYYRLMNEIVRDGFTSGSAQGAVFVRNDKYVAILAEKGEVVFDFPGYTVLEASQPLSGTSVRLRPGMWVVVQKAAGK
jgi:hypothetical protein